MLFFFFKQKTAYEVRISDWSSDVCSSDLPLAGARDDGEGSADIDPELRHDRAPEEDMFIAMNRFRIVEGMEAEFESIWRARDSHLEGVPGFVEFHLLRGPEAEDHTIYASHTVWQSRRHFEDWTKSEAFLKAHARTGDTRQVYLGHPEFDGFVHVI